ncbi:hypothetical protein NEOLEDRAFT_571248 [Neolentinus lepideus HHB14362 ss-1]|uniref:Uncharacterized protein n=1 Tax=Neolentinus lepideus HHB14362 ss-1 TaxID=1314782 RepID=A0A165R072_9AGAM|nr:hypothetical protein NEOLEDRAFT_571248 [Neolentinus lepideus HHB14362 ss-1]
MGRTEPADVNTTAEEEEECEYEFCGANVPEGISLRNFGVQVPIYATLSDIVVYSPSGDAAAARALASQFAGAVGRKGRERGGGGEEEGGEWCLLVYALVLVCSLVLCSRAVGWLVFGRGLSFVAVLYTLGLWRCYVPWVCGVVMSFGFVACAWV